MRALLALAVAAGALAPAVPAAVDVHPPTTAAAASASAASLLAGLQVAAPDRAHRYHRARFGYDGGFDADGDGCTTRKEVLIRDHIGALSVSRSCAVRSTWRSLYDGRVTSDPLKLEVDHLVPLAEAWHAGAWRWSARQRIAFGNDLGYRWSLQAVTASLNQDKRDQDPARWLPKRNRCTYAAAWIGVKSRWRLSVDRAERDALRRILERCGSPRVLRPGRPDLARLADAVPRAAVAAVPSAPAGPTLAPVPVVTSAPAPAPSPAPVATVAPLPVAVPTPVATVAPAPVVTPTPVPTAAPVVPSSPAAYYASCSAVRAAGRAPLHRGDPGYRSGLDRDGDGIACET